MSMKRDRGLGFGFGYAVSSVRSLDNRIARAAEEVAQDTAQVFLVVDNEDALAHEPLALDAKLNWRLVPRSRSILFTEVANVEGCGRPMQAL